MPPRNAGRRRSLVPDPAAKKNRHRMLSTDDCPEVGLWNFDDVGSLKRAWSFAPKIISNSETG